MNKFIYIGIVVLVMGIFLSLQISKKEQYEFSINANIDKIVDYLLNDFVNSQPLIKSKELVLQNNRVTRYKNIEEIDIGIIKFNITFYSDRQFLKNEKNEKIINWIVYAPFNTQVDKTIILSGLDLNTTKVVELLVFKSPVITSYITFKEGSTAQAAMRNHFLEYFKLYI